MTLWIQQTNPLLFSRTNHPPMSESMIKKREALAPANDFTPEDLHMLDLDWDQWKDPTHMLRQDEVLEMSNLLDALSLAVKKGILVLSPTFGHEVELLKRIDWLSSDTEPIDHTGAPAFADESLLKNAWLHGQKITLTEMLIMRYDPARIHWLLFRVYLDKDKIVCYEPLSQHGETIDIEEVVVIAQFFKPRRGGIKPDFDNLDYGYEVKLLDVQTDGASCGFWMVTIAFLIICEVPIRNSCINLLKLIGVENIKEHWKCLLTSWRVEEKGLGRDPVNNFLRYWDGQFNHNSSIARRPRWIPRYNPQAFLQAMAQPVRDPDDPANQATNMRTDQQIQMAIGKLGVEFDRLEAEKGSLVFGSETLEPDHLRRFLKGLANDEVINMFVAVLRHSLEATVGQEHLHFASAFRVPRPSRKFALMTTFFYPKLRELFTAQNPSSGSEQKAAVLEERLLRWFKKTNFEVHKSFLLPVNEPPSDKNNAGHWLLVEIDFPAKAIYIYDSLPPSFKPDDRFQGYGVVIGLIFVATQVISTASSGLLSPAGPDWNFSSIPVPRQNNAVDCGFFTIMFMLHLVYWGELNPPECCPPILSFSANSMHKTRIILATRLIDWLGEYWAEMAELSPKPAVSSSPTEPMEQSVPRPIHQEDDTYVSEPIPEKDQKSITTESYMELEPPLVPPSVRTGYSPVPSSVDGEDEELAYNSALEPLDEIMLKKEAPEVQASELWSSSLSSLPPSFQTPPPPP
ncbi:hypothetical protein MVEN_00582300 [Mycena venus]|uniref:Ubiquitin-like protease family profile domain-containing protein n=1 Tax=Mycena venus TaxID=2733690 RepID=A0A8H6YPB8_9AGAR|nr:hypothetical protein MVEN_00582300 [Mycena venus]